MIPPQLLKLTLH